MKKLIPILFFIFLITSCEKEDCYLCETTTYSSYNDMVLKYESEIACFKTELERLHYMTSRYNFDNPGTYTACECTKR